MTLANMLRPARERWLRQIGGTLDALTAVADGLSMKETAANFKAVHERLQADSFTLTMGGQFKTGKSTLANALLGPLTHPIEELGRGQGFMPVDDLPCTATYTSTRIGYAEKPHVRAWKFNGTSEEWSLARYLRDSRLRTDEEETQRILYDICEFEVGLPLDSCLVGVTLIESSGIGPIPARTKATLDAINRSDAAIAVYRSNRLFGDEDERVFTSEALGSGIRVFTVVNIMDGGPVINERFKKFTWHRLVEGLRGGPAYAGQDFTAHDIYFVDALKAQTGKLTNNTQLVAESGLALLEQQLAKFLLNDRQGPHMKRFLHRAEFLTIEMERLIAQQQAVIEDASRTVAAQRQALKEAIIQVEQAV